MCQHTDETFTAFCNRVELEASHCYFKCHNDCTAETIATRDQIIIGTHHQNIHKEALLKSWDLRTLHTEGMKMESACRGAEIGGENVNKVGKYSYKNTKHNIATGKSNKDRNHCKPTITCFYCGNKTSNLTQHRESSKGNNNKCTNCSKIRHLPSVCRSKDVKNVSTANDEHDDTLTYNVNLFVINASKTMPKPRLQYNSNLKKDFSVQVIINNSLNKVLTDTGASVCGTTEARKWGYIGQNGENENKNSTIQK